MRVVTLRGRVSFWDHCIRGSVIFLRDVVKILCIFSFLSFLDTLFLYFRSCDHFYLHTLYLCSLYVDVCFSFTYPLHVLFLFSLYTYVSHKDALMSLFKVFQKYRMSKSTCHKLSYCKVFQEFVLG